MARQLTPLLLVAAALLIAPLSGAVVANYGSHVTDEDADTVYELDTTIFGEMVLIDIDSDERPDPDEPVVLVPSGTRILVNSVRIAYPMQGQVGSMVKVNDADQGREGVALGGQLAYADQDGDGGFSPGDHLFWDLDTGSSGSVSIGDIYLTGPAAGTVVSSRSNLLSFSLTPLSGGFGVDDRDGNGLDDGDRVLVDGDDDGRITTRDTRLSAHTAEAFGDWVRVGQTRVTLPLVTDSQPTHFVLIDNDEDLTVDPEEPVFLSRSTDRVEGGSIRLFAPITGDVGSSVRGGDTDLGSNVFEIDGSLTYAGSGGITSSKPLIIDHSGDGEGTGNINELIISGQEAGSLIDTKSPHLTKTLTPAPGSIAFLDTDGDGSFGLNDVLYLDVDEDRFVSAGDVQLSQYVEDDVNMADPEPDGDEDDDGGSTGDDEGDTGTTDTDGDGVPDSQDDCPNTPGEASDGCPPDADQDGVPDDQDDCPEVAGSSDDGCPADSDGDGVPDGQDSCPNFPAETADGCPVDEDGDGVSDDEDACPSTPATTPDGCPADSDGDGVVDPEDACPDEAGPASDGCPEPALDDGPGQSDDEAEGQQGSPGPAVWLVLMGVAALALARRRQG